MKGYTIQHSIELLEKEAGSGSGGASTAAQVSFDNTGTGLVATNVQGAITELDAKGHTYSTTEKVVGTWLDNSPVYEKVVEVGALANNSAKSVNHGIENLSFVVSMEGVATRPGDALNNIPLVFVYDQLTGNISLSVNATQVNVRSFTDMTAYTQCYVILRYVKTAPASNTRSKKTKKEE